MIHDLIMIETTVKPFERSKVLERELGKGAIEKKYKDKIYFESAPKDFEGAIYFINDRTYLYAASAQWMEKTLDNLNRPQAPDPLDKALSFANKSVSLW